MSDTLENGLYHPEFRSNLKSIGRGRASPNRQRGFRTGSPNDVVAHAAAHGLGHVWPWLVFLGACVAALMIYVEGRRQRGQGPAWVLCYGASQRYRIILARRKVDAAPAFDSTRRTGWSAHVLSAYVHLQPVSQRLCGM